jgi:hypothetical protein
MNSSLHIIKMMKERSVRWGEHVACTGYMRNAYNIWGIKPEGKGSLGRPRYRWKDNNIIVCKQIGYELDTPSSGYGLLHEVI